MREIGGELQVGMILEGSVRRARDRVRITARARQSVWEPSIAPLRSDPRFREFKRKFDLA